MKDLIDLQHAHATQLTNEGKKGDWRVRKNITNTDLFTLPKTITDQDVFVVLDFARKYELIAFNAGIDFAKGKQNTQLRDEHEKLKEQFNELNAYSLRLQTKLADLIITPEN